MKDIGLIHAIAWSFQKTTGTDFDELFSEAVQAYMTAKQTYEPGKVKFSTWFYHCAQQRLTSIDNKVRKESALRLTPENIENIPYQSCDELQRWSFLEELHQLGHDAKTVCKLVFNSPREYLELMPKMARGKIYRKLRRKGWAWKRIWDAIREVKEFANQ
mgnify:FL=1